MRGTGESGKVRSGTVGGLATTRSRSAMKVLVADHATRQFGDAIDTMFAAPSFDLGNDFFRGAGIPVAGGTNLDGRGASEHELDNVSGGRDSTHTDDRNSHGACGLVDHAHGNGLDSGSGETCGDVGNAGSARFDVNCHGHKRVDERNSVGSAEFGDLRHLRNARDIGREFYDQGSPRDPLGSYDDVL